MVEEVAKQAQPAVPIETWLAVAETVGSKQDTGGFTMATLQES